MRACCVCLENMNKKEQNINLILIVCVFLCILWQFSLIFHNYRIRKLLRLRIFPNKDGKRWETNIMDKDYEILCNSQITLYYNIKGNSIDFHRAMHPNNSRAYYERFIIKLRTAYKPEKIQCKPFNYCFNSTLFFFFNLSII